MCVDIDGVTSSGYSAPSRVIIMGES